LDKNLKHGMRTDPMPDTFEWWYFQGTMDDNSTVVATFFTKPWMVSEKVAN